jgi:hypothetical protein
MTDDTFGPWFVGLFDGEGSFVIKAHPYTRLYCKISMKATKGNREALAYAYRCLGVGRTPRDRGAVKNNNGTPGQINFKIHDVDDIMNVIIPLFDRCSLRTSKAAEYAVWKEVVQLRYRLRRYQRRPPELITALEAGEKRISAVRDAETESYNMLMAEMGRGQEGDRRYKVVRATN